MQTFFKRPWLIVAVIGILTVFFALQLPRAEIDNNNLRFVPANNEALLVSQRIDDAFGSSLFILIGLERKYGTVFDADFLRRLREYVTRVEELEMVENVNSLVTTDYITGDGDAVIVEKLVGNDFSGTAGEIAELKRRVLSWDMYERTLISDDFSATQILIPLNIRSEEAGSREVSGSFIHIRNLAREMFDGMAEVYVTGLPVVSATINEAVNADLIILVPLVVIVVLGILFFSFRRFTAVSLPLLTVAVAAVWAIGAMPLFGVKLSVISTVLPVILIAVGSAYGIHVITHYITDRGDKPLSTGEHRELVFELLRKIGKPVFLAALTTFAGFFSNCFTSVLPIREFGIFSSFGVMAAFGVAVTLIPALLLIRGPRPLNRRNQRMPGLGKTPRVSPRVSPGEGGRPEFDSLSITVADSFVRIVRKKRFILFATLAAAAISLYGLSKIIIDNIMVEYFKPDTDIYKSDVFIREKFGGSKVVSVVFESDTAETLLHPDSLSALEGLNVFLSEKVPEAGKVMGFTGLIKRINQVFNVGESPDGLRPAGGEYAGNGADAGFGFEAADAGGFGFGGEDAADLGFGFGMDEGVTEEAASVIAGTEESPGREEDPGTKTYTAQELAALFDRAAGKNLGMDANSLVKEVKRLVNYEGAAYYEIPTDPLRYGKTTPEELQRLVSNYLVLLSGNISDYANDPLEPTAVKTTVQLRTVGQHDSNSAYQEINNYVAANTPDGIRVTVGGAAMVEAALNTLVVQSQLVSVIVSLVLVFIIIAVSNRSFVVGAVGIAPLSISILINFAVMGFAGIKLNIGTAMVASVSVGIGIDYTIHFLEAYKREYRAAGGGEDFLHRVYATSGKAILINAASVGAGFAVLLFSRFNMLADLGLLIALTMATSALVSLTVIPVLLNMIQPQFRDYPRIGKS
ncbi:MAG: MMPL family transporter [Spirochaetaceae bacterium]|jgi:predicted RND superfamily exporter protein|nr:MMPL family transporter [Spirochaetaceae bacterium]